MKINFHEARCQSSTSASLFGVCDNQDATPAYIDTTDKAKWIAIVENGNSIEIDFTALDHCIAIFRANGEMDSRCDGMMTYPDNIVFIELKEVKTGGWISGGIEQLKNTVLLFANDNDIYAFKKRRAFLSNKKHPKFQYGHQEQMQQFKNETGFRLIIHDTIKI